MCVFCLSLCPPPPLKEVLRLARLLPSSFTPTAWGSRAGQARVPIHNRNEMDGAGGSPESNAPAPGWALGEDGWSPVSLPSHIEMTLPRKKGIPESGIGVLWPPKSRRVLLPRRRHI